MIQMQSIRERQLLLSEAEQHVLEKAVFQFAAFSRGLSER
jgi:hypothetical protein